MSWSQWLNAPIPRKRAIVGVLLGQVGTVAVYVAAKQTLKEGDAIINDQRERLHVYDESVKFLLEHADPLTLNELNENLEFWRVIRGKSVRPDSS